MPNLLFLFGWNLNCLEECSPLNDYYVDPYSLEVAKDLPLQRQRASFLYGRKLLEGYDEVLQAKVRDMFALVTVLSFYDLMLGKCHQHLYDGECAGALHVADGESDADGVGQVLLEQQLTLLHSLAVHLHVHEYLLHWQ